MCKKEKQKAIIVISERGMFVAEKIEKELKGELCIVLPGERGESIDHFIGMHFNDYSAFIFIGAMGICVRSIAPYCKDKHTDPAVIVVDSTGKYVIPVLSGHIGGANVLAKEIAAMLGADPVITTQSDNTGMWALDTLGARYGWETFTNGEGMNKPIAIYVNGGRTALLLDIKSDATAWMERTKGETVEVFYHFADIPADQFELIVAVTPYLYMSEIPMVTFVPKVLHLGVGCRKGCDKDGVYEAIYESITNNGLNPAAIASVSTIHLKKDEPLLKELGERVGCLTIYSAQELKDIEVPNPSKKAFEVTGVYGVAEGAAIKSADGGALLIEKQKGGTNHKEAGNHYTFAVALDATAQRKGHIEIVGAGPGDPELVSVRGKRMLEEADLILYAGSLVPKELTHYAKAGAVVRSSAGMDLNEQFALMKEFYDRNLFIVRLHTGDPCIYGAIQEQMAFFDRHDMSYHITPGISSFLAAAAELQSQFTIPERVQTIILTRGEGRTCMPEREKLSLLARSQSTMCIFLSAGVADQVQAELLEHYPPTTPVAACYHLTWKDQKIYRGVLQNLAAIIKDHNLTLTTMIVVGEAIDNRKGLSRLYAPEFKHLFR
ncbi:MAG: precorrin-4 C(11)-methyltransferase [Bacteroidales bacterium]